MERQVVTIFLKPHLADFLRHEFTVNHKGQIVIHRKHDIGRHITSLVKDSETPVSTASGSGVVHILIPSSRMADFSTRYLFVDKWGEERISDFVQTVFDMRAKHFFEKGYTVYNYKQHQIIEAFLEAYNIKENRLSYDAVKQNDFRRRRKTRKEIAKELQQSSL